MRPERVVGLLAFTLGLVGERTEVSVSSLIAPFKLEAVRKGAFPLTEDLLAWLYG